MLTRAFDQLVAAAIPEDSQEVRPDNVFYGAYGEERWTDVSCCHTTQASQLGSSLRYFKALPFKKRAARLVGRASDVDKTDSPPVRSRHAAKTRKFAQLLQMSAAQQRKGLRRKVPVFAPVVLSHTGEWSQGCIQTIEWLCKQYKINLAKSCYSAVRRARAIAAYRTELKDGLACIVASGVGGILSVGGHRFVSAADCGA